MVDLQSSTSPAAITHALPSIKPLGLEDACSLAIVYNMFEPDKADISELEWRRGIRLHDYVHDLPAECEWLVHVNGRKVDLAEAKKIKIERGDKIIVVLVPQGKSMKSILQMVAMIAVAVVMAHFGAPVWAIGLGMSAVGIVSSLLFMPKAPRMQENDDSQTYGIDGPKNSATEGIVYPVVYGTFRMGGNISDCYTANEGDDQYLYMRTVLNDGKVGAINQIEINEQPLEAWQDVWIEPRLGGLDQAPNPWFERSIVQKNKASKLTETWTTHITDDVDFVRFDVTFPRGLVDIDQKKGTHRSRSVAFETEHRKLSAAGAPLEAWKPLPTQQSNIGNATNGTGGAKIAKAFIDVTAPAYSVLNGTPKLQYSLMGANTWVDVPSQPEFDTSTVAGVVFDASNDGSIAGSTNVTPMLSAKVRFDAPSIAAYDFRGVDGLQITKIDGWKLFENIAAQTYPAGNANTFVITDSRTRPVRKSFESAQLTKGRYEVRIRRTTTESTGDFVIDEVHLADIGEIQSEGINLAGTANLALRIRLSDQLNQIPNVTALVTGSEINIYDVNGEVTSTASSPNPADIALDIALSEARGAMMEAPRIDWPKFFEFRLWCATNGLEFNGAFVSESNMGDALRTVMRVGYGMPVPFGKKMSVAIDKPRNPTSIFTSANIIAGSFQMNYLSVADRANEYEVSYFDKLDGNKQKTIRYVDPNSVTFSDIPRRSTLTLTGVDNHEQAKRELWRSIYSNRLLIRSITFDAWLDAITASIGDVALIQHSMMEWANDGRIKSGTATQLVLDKHVDASPTGRNILVHFSAVQLGTATINTVVGNKILVPTSSLSNEAMRARIGRVTLASNQNIDYEVTHIQEGVTFDTITLGSTPVGFSAGASIRFWEIDSLVERSVSSVVLNANNTSTVTLSSPLPAAPDELANYIYGEVVNVRKPYVLNGISGNGLEKRSLTFIEYHAGVYGPPEVEIPVPVKRVTDRQVQHVQNLTFDYGRILAANSTSVNGRVSWSSGHILNYGGADLYMSLNGEPFRSVGSAADVSEYNLQLQKNDSVIFKAVAYNKRGDRASFSTAPAIRGTVDPSGATLDAPTAFSVVTVAFEVNGTAKFIWTAPADSFAIKYQIQYKRASDSDWVEMGSYDKSPVERSGFPTGTWNARIRSIAGEAFSEWVVATPFAVVVTPGSIMADFYGGNNWDSSQILSPTLPPTGAIEHTRNKDGTVNVSVEYLWAGVEADIDGFRVRVTETPAP